MGNPGSGARRSERSRVLTWALWDTGSAGLSAIVVTFVFSVYLTGSGVDLHSGNLLYVQVSYDGTNLTMTITDPAVATAERTT